MNNILYKEFKLSSSIIVYFFILFGLMFLIPGYPILCGAFFLTLGIYKSYEYAREANDIVFSMLLPISKKDIVKGKYVFVCIIELITILLMSIVTILRMTLLKNADIYRNNFMMNANLFAIGAAFVIFGIFNIIFVGGYFKTAYKLGKPFLIYMIVSFLCILIFESLHHIPGLESLNAFSTDNILLQIILLIIGIIIWLIITLVSYIISCNDFDKIDL